MSQVRPRSDIFPFFPHPFGYGSVRHHAYLHGRPPGVCPGANGTVKRWARSMFGREEGNLFG